MKNIVYKVWEVSLQGLINTIYKIWEIQFINTVKKFGCEIKFRIQQRSAVEKYIENDSCEIKCWNPVEKHSLEIQWGNTVEKQLRNTVEKYSL